MANEQIATAAKDLCYLARIAVVTVNATLVKRFNLRLPPERWPCARAVPLIRRLVQNMTATSAAIEPNVPMLEKCLATTGPSSCTQRLDVVLDHADEFLRLRGVFSFSERAQLEVSGVRASFETP
eukprot:TRINITY_DN69847_c0_g1_i1.p1 TRINITY_DN69847_c0_g1~~TRINITY_DN69847_c0_g1_i1.p1  ORF type:complete len:125 (-),score=5.51 TRINITY_DN69847_c0_g1_i1:124-498(-)